MVAHAHGNPNNTGSLGRCTEVQGQPKEKCEIKDKTFEGKEPQNTVF
jgi:hypothetical protein